MKSILNSQFSPLSPCLCRTKTTPFALVSMASQSIICNNPFRIHNHLHLMSTSLSNYLICSIQSRSLHTEASRPPSGEVHVVVGPMFAGKTTRLLRRIQLENSSGRLELWNGMDMNCDRHCSDIPSFQVKSQKKDPNLDKVLKALCISGRLSEAIGLLCRTGLPVHERTYSLLLQECIFRKEYKKGRRIHAQMIVVGYIPNEYLKTKLLILYVKSGCLETAHILFNNLAEKCLISWNVMIAGYVQKGLEELGLYFFYRMRQTGLRPDQYTFASVFRACATLTALEPGKQAHGVMFKCRILENVIVNSALIDMYFKCSSISDGQQVFDKCSIRNTITWTALIAGYGLHGRVMEVLESFNRMKSEGFRPNYVTFLAVLTACSHGGLVDEGWEYFLSMERDYEIVPRAQHYAAMVDLLGRAGKLKEAYDFVLTSPCKEHSVIWGALLGACKIHGDMNLLRLASKEFFKLEPVNTGKYIVLANAYATSGLWDNVMEVRDVMRELGMTKEPGYSRIDIQYKVFFFFKGDKSHEQSDEIYEVVKKMTDILKDACIPDVSGD